LYLWAAMDIPIDARADELVWLVWFVWIGADAHAMDMLLLVWLVWFVSCTA
jgi:hypothetical protein